jgi:hypothetical protein
MTLGELCLAHRFGHGSRELPGIPSAEHEFHNADPTKTSSKRTRTRLARLGQSGTGITQQIPVWLAWPYIESLIRWWLAKVFFLRGLAGVMDLQGALEAARFEYPGHFMSSAAATYAGTSIRTSRRGVACNRVQDGISGSGVLIDFNRNSIRLRAVRWSTVLDRDVHVVCDLWRRSDVAGPSCAAD